MAKITIEDKRKEAKEQFYKIGDMFLIDDFLLVLTRTDGGNRVQATTIETGNIWHMNFKDGNDTKITKEELLQILGIRSLSECTQINKIKIIIEG